jgi:hypothetical protein
VRFGAAGQEGGGDGGELHGESGLLGDERGGVSRVGDGYV